jgi:hypothetical protein
MMLIDSDVLLAYTRGHLSLFYYWRFRLVIIHTATTASRRCLRQPFHRWCAAANSAL